MQKPGIRLAGDLSKDTLLYRYMSLSQLVALVETGTAYLTRIVEWDDTWEAPLLTLPTQLAGEAVKMPLWTAREILCGQCWSLARESDALWRIYSTSCEGVRIGTTVDQITDVADIEHGLLAPVLYFDDLAAAGADLRSRRDYLQPFANALLKRRAFEHEREVRLVTLDDEQCVAPGPRGRKRIYYAVNPASFLKSITVDPRSADWYLEAVQTYCFRAGLSIVPKRSSLYQTTAHQATGLVTLITPLDGWPK
jgi:hypothetical protein